MKKRAPKSLYPQFKNLKLTPKMQEFVIWYCKPELNWNATQAYVEAYASKDRTSARRCASATLKNPDVRKAIQIEIKKRTKESEELATALMSEWYKIATSDITQLLEIEKKMVIHCDIPIEKEVVSLKKLSDMPAHMRSCIKTLKQTSEGIEITLHDKNKSLDSIAKAIGLFVDIKKDVPDDYESLVERIRNGK